MPENIDGSNTQTAGTDVANAKKDAEKLQKKIKTVKKDKKIKNKTVRKAKSKSCQESAKSSGKAKKKKQEGMDAALVNQQLEEKVPYCGNAATGWFALYFERRRKRMALCRIRDVRGICKKASEVYTDDAAQELLTVYQKKGSEKAKRMKQNIMELKELQKRQKLQLMQRTIRHIRICA